MNKNVVIFGVLAIAVIGVSAYFFSQPSSSKAQGTIVLGITDATKDIENVSSIFITVNKVEMHNGVSGWTTVSNETKQYDLLALKKSGVVSLLLNTNVNVGTYDQVRLMVSKVIVVKNGIELEAKVPSSELKIVGNIVVNADKTSSVVFDFLADKSLHTTGNGKFIFAPVIKIKKQKNVKIELKSDNELIIKDGEKEENEDFGMNSKGEVKANFELKGILNIDDNDEIQGENGEGGDNNKQGDNNNDESRGETQNNLVFNFSAQNNSSFSGTTTLSEENGKVKVTLKLRNNVLSLLNLTQPAHIHLGSCANIGDVKYPLNSVVNGRSETMLNVSLAQIKAGFPLSVNVHKSVTEINVYVACTNLNF